MFVKICEHAQIDLTAGLQAIGVHVDPQSVLGEPKNVHNSSFVTAYASGVSFTRSRAQHALGRRVQQK